MYLNPIREDSRYSLILTIRKQSSGGGGGINACEVATKRMRQWYRTHPRYLGSSAKNYAKRIETSGRAIKIVLKGVFDECEGYNRMSLKQRLPCGAYVILFAEGK